MRDGCVEIVTATSEHLAVALGIDTQVYHTVKIMVISIGHKTSKGLKSSRIFRFIEQSFILFTEIY